MRSWDMPCGSETKKESAAAKEKISYYKAFHGAPIGNQGIEALCPCGHELRAEFPARTIVSFALWPYGR